MQECREYYVYIITFLNLFRSLQVRKEHWKKTEEERIANTPDPEMPPGHRLLPEKERQQTLKLLLTSRPSKLPNQSLY